MHLRSCVVLPLIGTISFHFTVRQMEQQCVCDVVAEPDREKRQLSRGGLNSIRAGKAYKLKVLNSLLILAS